MHKQYSFLLALLCSSLICITSPLAEEAVDQPPEPDAPVTEQVVDSPPDTEKPFTKDVFSWEKSTPTATDFDWVQLTSGEWLKGEIQGLYKDSLEFDSDKLDLLELDWDDVKYVETHIPGSAYIEGTGTVYGFFTINQTKIIVSNNGDKTEYDRSSLVSFITGGEEELDYWTAKITFGLNLRSGNTDQADYNAKLNLKRRTSFSRFVLDYIGNISKTSTIETINNHRASATSDRYKTRRFFYRPLFGEYYRDPFSNIDSKITIGTGLGYTIIDTTRTDLDIAGGPGYQETRFISVQPGENLKETTPALVVASYYEYELSKAVDFIYNYKITWVDKASGGYTHHMVTTFETEFIASLDFDVSLIWDHISNPTEAADGTIPEPDDYRLTIGLSLEY